MKCVAFIWLIEDSLPLFVTPVNQCCPMLSRSPRIDLFAPEYALHPGTYKLDEPFKTPARSIQWRQVLVLIMLLCSFTSKSKSKSVSIHFYPSTIEVLWYQSRLMYPSIPWKFPSEERDASHLGPFCSSTSRHPETGRPKCCAESVRRLCTSSSSSSP